MLKREVAVAVQLRAVEEAETRVVQAKTALAEAQARRADAASALEAARADVLRPDVRAASLEKALAAALRQATALRAPDGDGSAALSLAQAAEFVRGVGRDLRPRRRACRSSCH